MPFTQNHSSRSKGGSSRKNKANPAGASPAPALDVFGFGRQHLNSLFSPSSVAVIGATEKPNSVGRTIVWNLLQTSFGGPVYPVNPKRKSILGVPAYPSVKSLPGPVELAVIVTPAKTVPGIVKECVQAGVKSAIIISAGFKEIGEEGRKLEAEILKHAKGKMRIVGPNCLGVMRPPSGLNATFAHGVARPGGVGFVSQSGALLTSILDWSYKENVGFSAFVSMGSMLDVGWGDMIHYLGDDPQTKAIVLYMESIGDPRSFMSAAREVALVKPIIVIKAGRTEAAAKAAASHTGALTGADDVLDAAFRRCGVLRVNTISELFYMVEILGKQPRPKGPRLAILTNAGGPGVLAADALVTTGGQLAELSPETIKELDKVLPAHWSRGNPVDLLGDATPERYAQSVSVVARDPNCDGLLAILTPQSMTDPSKTAEVLAPLSHSLDKPIIASWMGGAEVAGGEAILNRANIPTFNFPDAACRLFNYMWRYSSNLESLYETPEFVEDTSDLKSLSRKEAAKKIIDRARRSKRTILTEHESKKLLSAYGIPVVETAVAKTAEEAAAAAEKIGFPVVLKLHSLSVTHKTDVGGVQLNLRDADAVKKAFFEIQKNVTAKMGKKAFGGATVQKMIQGKGVELIVGSSVDPQFGPVLLFGGGGTLVELYKDRALGFPPLNTTLARRMMEQTKIFEALKGLRGQKPADIAKVESLLVEFSRLVAEQPAIREIDINPLAAFPEGPVALDARVLLHTPEEEKTSPRMSIRPYPVQYIHPWKMKGVTGKIVIRPIRPEDEKYLADFHSTLSERSVYFRFLNTLKLDERVKHERLSRRSFIDYDREMVLVAERTGSKKKELLGVARLSRRYETPEAEFGLLIADAYQHRGLGTELLSRLLQIASEEGIRRVTASILRENSEMKGVVKKFGFEIKEDLSSAEVFAELNLPAKK